MLRSLKYMPALVLGLLMVLSQKSYAAGGKVEGTLVDKDGKAVADAKVQIRKPMQRGQGGPGGAGGNRPNGQVQDPGRGAGGGGRQGGRQQQPPVAEGTTDKDGKFAIADVPAGDYMVVVFLQGKGFARANVTVQDGETAKVELKLQDMPQRGQGGAGGGAGGAGGGRRGGQGQ
jgi:hypothetical protein